MLSKVYSIALIGISGNSVVCEANINKGMPRFEIVGLASKAVKESKERVRVAVKNSGYFIPGDSIVINLAPADMNKESPVYDLPIAVGLLTCNGTITSAIHENTIFFGELSLDGNLNPVNGALPMVIEAKRLGFSRVILPYKNAPEASYVAGIEIIAAKNLTELVKHLNGEERIKPYPKSEFLSKSTDGLGFVDFSYIKGQEGAKRAAEIAAAGNHNLLFIGPPGSGKTMLARATAGILPGLTFEEALEITKIYSVSGVLAKNTDGIINKRPFRSPHHSISMAALTGGGTKSQPGEVSLAHKGVLFLDELPEFPKNVLESMRAPLEDREVSVARVFAKVTYPADIMLITAMNPCPCGHYGSNIRHCNCTKSKIKQYINKVSGPFLDRIDLHVEMGAVSFEEWNTHKESENSKEIRIRVQNARNIQQERYVDQLVYNANLTNEMLEKYCTLDENGTQLLEMAAKTYGFSARTITRVLKVSRTIADLENSENILGEHIAEAVQYRIIDRKYWGFENE